MDVNDFEEWKGIMASIFDKGEHPLNTDAVDMGIGMLWPGQSYVNLKSFRGSSKRNTWGPYHTARVEMLAGDYNLNIILIFCNYLFSVFDSKAFFTGFE